MSTEEEKMCQQLRGSEEKKEYVLGLDFDRCVDREDMVRMVRTATIAISNKMDGMIAFGELDHKKVVLMIEVQG